MLLFQEKDNVDNNITPPLFSEVFCTYNVKCTNYLFRTYISNDSKKKGGYIGIE